MKLEETKEGLEVNPEDYKKHMRTAIGMLKLEKEYEELKAETLRWRLMGYKVIEELSKYEPGEGKEVVSGVNDESDKVKD